MQSFRTEFENQVVEKDIIELEKKIRLFKEGKIDGEKFRSLRLARGVYGQRQEGVQMIRIKIPFGKLTVRQLARIADVTDEYSTGKMHLTTRQDIQIHYVSLDRTPQLWAELEKDEVTLREACGNTVRNITASEKAGIDPNEVFDVSPYADQLFRYFLRNPVCQEMGRKFKIAFSSSEQDSAFSFIHDLGFIPKIEVRDGKEIRGFKVLIGGGLGAQPYLAEVAYEFLEEQFIVPFTEAVLRVFDRYGERKRRHKARLKFLLQEIGLTELLNLVQAEQKAVAQKSVWLDRQNNIQTEFEGSIDFPKIDLSQDQAYQAWRKTNVFEQKQAGFYGVYLKIQLGNFTTAQARQLVAIVPKFAANDFRTTINQGLVLRFVPLAALESLYLELKKIGFADTGFDSVADITACPGTDTCNLGISDSTNFSVVLEKTIREEYPDLVFNNEIKIKISGCPNSCGQHGLASIGFHGSSLKANGLVLPAVQVLLGGKAGINGTGRVADKVLKVPSKRGVDALRWVLNDYEANAFDGEYFSDYYERQGEKYFYHLLKPLTDLTNLSQDDFIDWGSQESFEVIKAVGECAGVIIDLFQTLLFETEEKLDWAIEAFQNKRFSDAIYHAYNVHINGAKAALLNKGIETNSQHSVIKEFDVHFVQSQEIDLGSSFSDYVLRINQNEVSEAFAESYIKQAEIFIEKIKVAKAAELALA